MLFRSKEYAQCCRDLTAKRKQTETWLMGEPSRRPKEAIQGLLELGKALVTSLERLTDYLKDANACALARQVDSGGIGIHDLQETLNGWTAWLQQHGNQWLSSRARAVTNETAGCDRKSISKLAQRYGHDTLRSWISDVAGITTTVRRMEQSPVPDRFVGRVLDREHTSLLIDRSEERRVGKECRL